jgi:hypothetical protein
MRIVRAVLLVSLVSCSPPRRDYDEATIAGVDDLEELMDVQATVADPRFRRAREVAEGSLTAADFPEFVDMGRRLAATGRRLAAFGKAPRFLAYGAEQVRLATELTRVAQAGDGPETARVALAIRQVCADCHQEFR